jgi:hypothetical protein
MTSASWGYMKQSIYFFPVIKSSQSSSSSINGRSFVVNTNKYVYRKKIFMFPHKYFAVILVEDLSVDLRDILVVYCI